MKCAKFMTTSTTTKMKDKFGSEKLTTGELKYVQTKPFSFSKKF